MKLLATVALVILLPACSTEKQTPTPTTTPKITISGTLNQIVFGKPRCGISGSLIQVEDGKDELIGQAHTIEGDCAATFTVDVPKRDFYKFGAGEHPDSFTAKSYDELQRDGFKVDLEYSVR